MISISQVFSVFNAVKIVLINSSFNLYIHTLVKYLTDSLPVKSECIMTECFLITGIFHRIRPKESGI